MFRSASITSKQFHLTLLSQAHKRRESVPVENQGSEVPAANLYSQQNFLGCCLKAGNWVLTNSVCRLEHTSWKTCQFVQFATIFEYLHLKEYLSIKLLSKCTAHTKTKMQVYFFLAVFSQYLLTCRNEAVKHPLSY